MLRRLVLAGTAVLFFGQASSSPSAEYPSCILSGLQSERAADFPLIFNVTTMCLLLEQVELPAADMASLAATGALVQYQNGRQTFRVTLTNHTSYRLTEVAVEMWNAGFSASYVSNGLYAVPPPGTMIGPSPNVLEDRTIRPLETREIEMPAPQQKFITPPSWRLLSVKGIPE